MYVYTPRLPRRKLKVYVNRTTRSSVGANIGARESVRRAGHEIGTVTNTFRVRFS